MAKIRLENVTKTFENGDVVAVDNLSLTIDDGEFLVLLGPSGCGKTTTLRMVAGLETRTDGDIYIGETLVNGLRASERDIAFVFQFYALYPHLNAWENISFPLRAQGLSKAEVNQRVDDVAKRLRISHILQKRPNQLPGGEQQRVALGRAMVRNPQVFLMDEPLTNLDAALRSDMRAELKYLQQDLGTTMIYVTHDQVEAMTMSHRIAVMNLGVLQQVGTPLDVYRHPETLFVAGFIGSPPMNIVECEVDNGQLISPASEFKYTLPDTLREAVSGHDRVHFGVRAEDVRILTTDDNLPDESTQTTIPGEIRIREPLGDETIYRVDIGGMQFNVKSAPKLVLKSGEAVHLEINPERIHLFDADTEQSLLKETASHV
jgi:ABC-type sugar transport system ATPase subunit